MKLSRLQQTNFDRVHGPKFVCCRRNVYTIQIPTVHLHHLLNVTVTVTEDRDRGDGDGDGDSPQSHGPVLSRWTHGLANISGYREAPFGLVVKVSDIGPETDHS